MSETKIVVPQGMLDAATQADTTFCGKVAFPPRVEAIVEAALRWADDNKPPINDEPARTLPRLVACAVIIRDGNVLLERRAPSGVAGLDGMWDLPGGKLECGETVVECLIREIAEELSICIRPTRLLPHLPTSDWVYADGERRHWVLAAYECDLISGEPACNERLQWFDMKGLPPEMLEADRRLLTLVRN
jgi:mutator protein MutT